MIVHKSIQPQKATSRRYFILVCTLVVAATGLTSFVHGQDEAPSASLGNGDASSQEYNFTEHVLPLLRKNCLACHYEKISEGSLSLENLTALRAGGDNGDAVNLQDPASSLLLTRALGTVDSIMPPEDNSVGAVPFTKEEIDLIQKWISTGAKDSTETISNNHHWQALAPTLRAIYSVAISPVDATVAVGRGNSIQLFNSTSGIIESTLADPNLSTTSSSPGTTSTLPRAQLDFVNALAFDPSGRWLASGDFQSVRIWQSSTAPMDATPAANTPSAALVQALADQVIANSRVPVTEEDRQRAGSFDLGGALVSLTCSVDRRLAVSVADTGTIRLWNWSDGQKIADLTFESSDSIPVAQQVRSLARQKAHAEFVAGLIPASEEVAKKEEEARLKTEETHKKQEEDVVAKTAKLTEAQAALQTAIAATEPVTDEQKAALQKQIDDAQAAVNESIKQSMSTAQALAAATDTRDRANVTLENLRSESEAEKVRLADLETAQATSSASGAQVLDVVFRTDSAQVAIAFNAGYIGLYSTSDGKFLQSLGQSATESCQLSFVGIDWLTSAPRPANTSTENPGEVNSTNQRLMAWRVQRQWQLAKVIGNPDGDAPFSDRITALDFSPDGKYLVIGCGEPTRAGEVHVINTSDWSVAQSWKEMHSDSVLSVRVSPDGRYLASSGADRQIHVVDFPSGLNMRTFEGHTHHVLSVAWQDDGRRLASAGADKTVKVWNTRSGEAERTINIGNKEVTSLAFVGTTPHIITTSGDGAVRLYNAADGALLRTFGSSASFQHASAVTFTGDKITAGGDDGTARVWKVDAPEIQHSLQ
jgi:WD40 repeat protein